MLTKFFGQDMENWAFYIKEISEEDDDWIQKVTLFVDILPTLEHTEIPQVNQSYFNTLDQLMKKDLNETYLGLLDKVFPQFFNFDPFI